LRNNFLNFRVGEDSRNIYRVMSYERFLQMLAERKNALVLPAKWDDPFENFILNGTIRTGDGKVGSIGFRDSLYGQCWSLHVETDAMWRMYSPFVDKRGVKLKTTIPTLFNSLYAHAGEFRDVSCFIGKVQYLTKAKIKDALEKVNILDSTGIGIAQTLLIKRYAFRPEREVRLIYFNQNANAPNGVFSYPIDPNALIREVVLDPRLLREDAETLKAEIKVAGFRNRVIQSGLYRPPENIILNIP